MSFMIFRVRTMIMTKNTTYTTANAASAHRRISRATFLPSFRGPARRMHSAAQGFNCRGVTEVVSKPLGELMILQPANQARVAVGAKDAAHERIFTVLVVNVRRLALYELLLTDRTFATLVDVDSVVVSRGETVDFLNPRPPGNHLFAPRVSAELLLPAR